MDILFSEETKLETEVALLLHRLMGFRSHLKEILKEYNVSNLEEIRGLIEKGEIEEHPAYEDYLDGITYKIEIQTLANELENRFQAIRSIP